jgi:hypothetical protein
MRRLTLLLVALFALPSPLWAEDPSQTDWCAGGGISGPVAEWAEQFDTSTGVSWLAVPGQLALTSTALATPTPHLLSDAYEGVIGVSTGDIDGDGDTDVVGSASTSGIVVFWENEGGDPISWTEHTVATPGGAAGVDVADIDSDGRLDIVCCCVAPRCRIIWRRNLGGDPVQWEGQVIEGSWNDAWEIATGDVNGDGHLDVMCTYWSLGDVCWWENDGNYPITWTPHTVDGTFGGAHSVRGADFDGDGDLDLAAAAGMAHEIAIYWNDGADPVGWTKQVVETMFSGARSVWIDDIDQDGDLDLAGICWTNHLAWWRNDGGNPVVWTPQIISSSCRGGHALCIADVNGDNRPDVLGACNVEPKMAWWENGGGDPIAWTEHVLDDVGGSITVRAADLDGDGDIDPVGGFWGTDEFTWWEATEFGSAGELTSSILDAQSSELGSIDWTSTEPTGTSISLQVRSSDDPGNMGSWSTEITSPGNLAETLDRYIQYRALLGTTDPGKSPILEQITFGPLLAGIEADAEVSPARFLAASPNPCNPEALISFGLRMDEEVRLSVFTATGRLVRGLTDGLFPAGTHHVRWNGSDNQGRALPSGVYFIRLETTTNQESRKLILLR